MNCQRKEKEECQQSPIKQSTPFKLPNHEKIGIHFTQSKNTINTTSSITMIDLSEDKDNEECDEFEIKKNSLRKKRKKTFSNTVDKNYSKIRKTFDHNETIIDKNNDYQELETHRNSNAKICPKALENELSSNIMSVSNNAVKSDKSMKKTNIDNQSLIEELDNFFEEEWSYKEKSMSELDNLFEEEWTYIKEIDLNTPKRCVIVNIIRKKDMMILTLKDFYEDLTVTIKCSGIWQYTKIEPGEPIVVKAVKESLDNKFWSINNELGYIINQPDTLISGTSVVGALFCNRRSALAEKFRMIESLPYNKVGNHYMLTGSLTHELLQKSLELDLSDKKHISVLLSDLLKSKHAIRMMYTFDISLSRCKELMQPAVTHIYNFIERYIKGIKPQISDKNFDGKIVEICDIEENVWLPHLGLKGKIDLTVKIENKQKNIQKTLNLEKMKILPLEVKTGKATFSNEHQGQLILYTMMMNMINQETNSGLLLYLGENVLKEIEGSSHAQRDLISLRNTVAYYLTRQPIIVSVNGQETVLPMEFPKPINHQSCAKCPYNTLCSVYLTEENKKDFNEDHQLKIISENTIGHLSKEHITYVMKWVSLLQIDHNTEDQDEHSLKDIWTIPPCKRENRGLCISNLNLISVVDNHGRFLHEFHRVKKDEIPEICKTDFIVQDYVIISTDRRINICSGYIDSISSSRVIVNCEKNITKVYKDKVFHIDKYTSSTLVLQNLSQLGGLLDNHEVCSRLRKIVIDREPATFTTAIPSSITTIGEDVLKNLNKYQQQAIIKTLAADSYILIKGYPGTGKTQTLVSMVELMVKLDKTVLITAHTNAALDNILLKLLDRGVDFIRFGSRAHPKLSDKLEDNLIKDCDSPESLHTVYCSIKVIGVTCYGATHPHLSRRKFDICIVDESTQVLQPTILRPLFCASKFVLVGDPEQLPPVAKNNTARKLGINESLFTRLDSEENSVVLKLQYRMNKCIMHLANKLTYHDQLLVGDELIANATLPVTNIANLENCEMWVQKALSMQLKNSTILLNTSATHHLPLDPTLQHVKGNSNYWEAAIVNRLIQVLLNLGINPRTIGVISPYRAQVRLIRKIFAEKIEVNTVDQYQGQDRSVIIYSCSKSIPKGVCIQEFDILDDMQRLTVAITRAKHKLIIIGDGKTLQRFDPFKKILSVLKETGHIIDLLDDKDDFSLKDLMQHLLYKMIPSKII